MLKFFKSFLPKKVESNFSAITPEKSEHVASISAVILNEGVGHGFLISSDTLVTLKHNFPITSPKKATVIRPNTQESAKIKSFKFFDNSDIAFLKLNKKLKGPYAQFDFNEHAQKKMPIVVADFISQHEQSIQTVFDAVRLGDYVSLTKKGKVLLPSTPIKVPDGKILNVTLFNAISVKGVSGAPIINGNGKVISILQGGKHSTSSGCTSQELYHYLKEYGYKP